jgi:hypothetical protein
MYYDQKNGFFVFGFFLTNEKIHCKKERTQKMNLLMTKMMD